jgi:hypothetical protein
MVEGKNERKPVKRDAKDAVFLERRRNNSKVAASNRI